MQLTQIPSYDELVIRFNLEILKSPGDLVIKNGDLALTKSGDLMLNDAHYSAMHRFVQAWRFNTPMLRSLFDLTMTVSSHSRELQSSLDQVFDNHFEPTENPFLPNAAGIARLHDLNDQIDANTLGAESCSGAIILIVTGLLLALKDDINATRSDWEKTAPLIQGSSVGAILVAASNYFRHWDEWTKTATPSARQASSIDVLNAVLMNKSVIVDGISHPMTDGGTCTKVLNALSDGDFEKLSEKIFTFASDLRPNSAIASDASLTPK